MVGHLHRMVADWASAVVPSSRSRGASNEPLARSQIPPVLLEPLTVLQRIASQRSLRQTGHLLRFLARLREVGVDAMPYKGPVSAQCLYGDVSLRTWQDLDLVVPHEQLPLLRQALTDSGLVDASPFNAQVLRRKERGWGEIAFRSEDSGVNLDVHWNVTVGFSGGSLAAERLLFDRAAPASSVEKL